MPSTTGRTLRSSQVFDVRGLPSPSKWRPSVCSTPRRRTKLEPSAVPIEYRVPPARTCSAEAAAAARIVALILELPLQHPDAVLGFFEPLQQHGGIEGGRPAACAKRGGERHERQRRARKTSTEPHRLFLIG